MKTAGSTTRLAVMQKIMLAPAMTPSSASPTKSLKQRVKKAAAVVLPPVMMATPVCCSASVTASFTRAAMAEFLLVAAENLDAEIDADAEHHRDDRDGKDVEMADDEQGEAERPEHRHDQDENGERRPQKGAVTEEEEADDQRHGDAAGLGGVGVGLLRLVGIEGGLAGQLNASRRDTWPRFP